MTWKIFIFISILAERPFSLKFVSRAFLVLFSFISSRIASKVLMDLGGVTGKGGPLSELETGNFKFIFSF